MTLTHLENPSEFIARHVGPDDHDIAGMLKLVGADSLDDLIKKVAPAAILNKAPLDLPPPMTEAAALGEMRRMAGKNKVLKSYLGQGYHGTHTPGVILRNIL